MVYGKRYLLYIRLIAAAMLAAVSCSDDPTEGLAEGPEGGRAVISLQFALPEMQSYTRSDLSEKEANEINTLWVGIYNSQSGERTFSRFYESGELARFTDAHQFATLSDIETKSGLSYIVAVANVDYNTGVSPRYGDGKSAAVLRTLLEQAADTYEDFLAIAVISPGPGSVATPYGNLPMSGGYCEEDPEQAIEWEELYAKPVRIPASASAAALPGAIHLRRLTAQIRFNISTGKSAGTEIISVEPYQWQVFNVPEMGWLYERGDGDGVYETANAGDLLACLHPDPEDNYGDSAVYTSQYFTRSDGTYSFDFYQMENKRTGLDLEGRCETYADREKEFDCYGNINTGRETGSYVENSGVFASLCETKEGAFPNNCATYVRFRCRIEYVDKTAGDDITGLEGAIRKADAVYTVHLGYIGGDPKDFRTLRNSKYTYNVKITDVQNLLVEAYREGETQPGAEGFVTDVIEEYIVTDSHYSAFNIKLSDQERRNFTFLILAYYDGELITVQDTNSPVDRMFWNWVEFRPTESGDVLAAYKPRTGDYADGETYTLAEMGDPDRWPGQGSGEEKWYTVFVNEYVYESDDDLDSGYNQPQWVHYVNQPSRKLFINVQDRVAHDGQTAYFRSKYGIEQKSMQTYYDLTHGGLDTAIGIEHVNESFGLDLRWIYTINKYGRLPDNAATAEEIIGLDISNGRRNTLKYIDDIGDKWETYVKETEPFTMPAVSDIQGTFPARPAYLPTLVTATPQDGWWNGGVARGFLDPVTGGDARYVEVLNACMNRNRDLNGDGRISNDEIRWYLPTTGRYLRIILGSRSLDTPLMDYPAVAALSKSSGGLSGINNGNTRYHFATSDGRVIWSEEDLAVSFWGNNDSKWQLGAWEVRCIRSLGVDFSQEMTDITRAYVHDPDQRKITMEYYEAKSIRQSPFVEPPRVHTVADELNACYKAFEYDSANTLVSLSSISIREWYDRLTYGNPCQKEGESGWRVPNMNELAIMRNLYGEGEIEKLFPYTSTETDRNGAYLDNYGKYILLSCTKEYYANNGQSGIGIPESNDTNGVFTRFMGANNQQCYAVNCEQMEQQSAPFYFYVRCVRDVEP